MRVSPWCGMICHSVWFCVTTTEESDTYLSNERHKWMQQSKRGIPNIHQHAPAHHILFRSQDTGLRHLQRCWSSKIRIHTSRYQSANSSQMKSETDFKASMKRCDSNSFVTSILTSWQRLQIYLSARGKVDISFWRSGPTDESAFCSTIERLQREWSIYFPAFQSLLTKFLPIMRTDNSQIEENRWILTRSMSRRTSWPAVVPCTSADRSASQPYSSIAPIGSTTFPTPT